MSAKSKSKAATALAAANEAQGIPASIEQFTPAPSEPVETPATPATVAIVAQVQKVEPVSKRGKSSVESPVAQVWVNCHNLITAAKSAGQALPSRKALVAYSIANGIAYYTARTQVQAYLKASLNGTITPKKLPRDVQLAS
jgi:hypothetical protein